jgi:hypothetical protein
MTEEYKFGGTKGHDLNNGIDMNLMRPSLLNTFRCGKPIPFGPSANQSYVPTISEDEESEIDITDYPPPVDGQINEYLPSNTPSIITSITPQQSDRTLSKPKIADKALSENKGFPGIRDVLDHMIDLPTLVELVSEFS